MRVMDGLLCFPPILLGIFVVTFLGPSLAEPDPGHRRPLRPPVHAGGARQHARRPGARVRRERAGAGGLGAASRGAGHPAQHRGADPRPGLARRRPRHPARVGALVPGPRPAAAHRRPGGAWSSSRAASCSSPPCRSSGPRRPSRSRCSRSTSWETGYATCSTPGSGEAPDRGRPARSPALGRRRGPARARRPRARQRDVLRDPLRRGRDRRARREALPVRRELPGLLLPPDLHGDAERHPPRPRALPCSGHRCSWCV